MFEWTPSIDNDGRILYARWDYVDRYNMPYMSLWSTMPDGSNAQAIFGNYTVNPHCVFEARRIPDSRKLIFTASGHHAFTGGCLVLLDAHRAADGEAAMTRLTPEVCFPESEGWPQTYFGSPFPLSENHYLTAWSAQPLPPGTPHPDWGMPGPANDLGLYLFDAFGNLNLIYRDPEIGSETPLPIRRRVPERLVHQPVAGQDASEGRMVVADVYQGLAGVPRGAIRQLRLVGVPVKTHPTMNYPPMGLTHDDPGKFVLGTVPVEPDGSAHFRVPAGVTFFVQALDEQGVAVQTMRSATYVQPGQTVTCIGCHEPRNTAPPNRPPLSSRACALANRTGARRLVAAAFRRPGRAGAGTALRPVPSAGCGRVDSGPGSRTGLRRLGRLWPAEPADARFGTLSPRPFARRGRRGATESAEQPCCGKATTAYNWTRTPGRGCSPGWTPTANAAVRSARSKTNCSANCGTGWQRERPPRARGRAMNLRCAPTS